MQVRPFRGALVAYGLGDFMLRLTEANEDYIEAIVMLNGGTMDPVRSVDLAKHMGVAKPSINKAVSLLKAEGLVTQEPYGDIYITEAGLEYGLAVLHRHTILTTFLSDVLGVEPELAAEEACRMEHTISADTFERWTEFVEGFMAHHGTGEAAFALAKKMAGQEIAEGEPANGSEE